MIDPGNVKPYDKLWAVLSVDALGNEGICAVNTPLGPQVCVTGSERVLEVYLDAIKAGALEIKQANKRIVVATFIRSHSLGWEI